MPVQKGHILNEIRRTAATNGGVPLGVSRFQQETGIKVTDWHGKHWIRWGDALTEAGFAPNVLQGAYSDDKLLDALAGLCRDLGRFPVVGELKLKRRSDPAFPNAKVFQRFGGKQQLARRLAKHCQERGGMDDVVAMCAPVEAPAPVLDADEDRDPPIGFVYLLKSGRHYKIGKSNAAGRREREIALQMPETTKAVHVIRTDDPAGIEAYWHSRFSAKRRNGEWFDLDASDLRAFKRRKFM